MKKKTKFLMKVNKNNQGKVYINGKWRKGVNHITVLGNPADYNIEISEYRKNPDGTLVVKNDELVIDTKKYHIGN